MTAIDRKGQIFFMSENGSEELILTEQQKEEFVDLVLDSGVFNCEKIKTLLALPDDVPIHVSGWDFSRRYH